MARIPITVLGYRCERCAHEWVPASYDVEPVKCPDCGSAAWDKPRSPMLTYEQFSKKIKTSLQTEGAPLTWTEIRTRAGLPQKFPNNDWVHRLERDIGLVRSKDGHGIIKWDLSGVLNNA